MATTDVKSRRQLENEILAMLPKFPLKAKLCNIAFDLATGTVGNVWWVTDKGEVKPIESDIARAIRRLQRAYDVHFEQDEAGAQVAYVQEGSFCVVREQMEARLDG